MSKAHDYGVIILMPTHKSKNINRSSNFKKTIVIGFDNFLHKYDHVWKGPEVTNGGMVEGSDIFLAKAILKFKVNVYGPRSSTIEGRDAMYLFCLEQYGKAIADKLVFPEHLPPAWLIYDYRVVPFNGEFLEIEELNNFVPLADMNEKLKIAREKYNEAFAAMQIAQREYENVMASYNPLCNDDLNR